MPDIVQIPWNVLRNKIPDGLKNKKEIEELLAINKDNITFNFVLDGNEIPEKLTIDDFEKNFPDRNAINFLRVQALRDTAGLAISTPGTVSYLAGKDQVAEAKAAAEAAARATAKGSKPEEAASFIVNIPWNVLRDKIPDGLKNKKEIEELLAINKDNITFQFVLDSNKIPKKLTIDDFGKNFLGREVINFLRVQALRDTADLEISTPGAASYLVGKDQVAEAKAAAEAAARATAKGSKPEEAASFIVNIPWNVLRDKIPDGLKNKKEIEELLAINKDNITFQFVLDSNKIPKKLTIDDFRKNFLGREAINFLRVQALRDTADLEISTPGAASHLAGKDQVAEAKAAAEAAARATAKGSKPEEAASFIVNIPWNVLRDKIPDGLKNKKEIEELLAINKDNITFQFVLDSNKIPKKLTIDDFGKNFLGREAINFLRVQALRDTADLEISTPGAASHLAGKDQVAEAKAAAEAAARATAKGSKPEEDEPDLEDEPELGDKPKFRTRARADSFSSSLTELDSAAGVARDTGGGGLFSGLDTRKAPIFSTFRKQPGKKLADIATQERILSSAVIMDIKDFTKIMDAWKKEVNKRAGKKDNLYENVKCEKEKGKGDSYKTTITLPDKTTVTDVITHSYVDDRPKVTMTNPPSDQSIFLFMKSSKEMAPLTLQAPCGNVETALKLYEASIISGTKIELHPQDVEALEKSAEHKDHFNALRDIADNDGAKDTLRAKVKDDPNYELGKKVNMPEPSEVLTLIGKKGTPPKKK